MSRSVIAWALILVIAGSVAVALCIATAPVASADAPRDFFDSPFLLPAFLVLAVLAGLAGWFVPQVGVLWGLVAAAPFYVSFAPAVIKELREGGQGLWPVGLLFLVGLTLIPVAAALTTSLVVRARG
ncbi:hypothetical protein [Nonomuraea guangzhouensis]|uniref:Uncharacterized protein n=1 Tax=Nonomuraea guangzhouensis TaxID=1291555 RepID=A0ABW4GBP4_9ACTN|nr:hypothetical protein [Nonomuraea guangzhouensis]